MSTGAAGDGLLRVMFEGCISAGDMGIERRPYHKNCKCAMHKARGHCTHSSRYTNVSYPIRRSWSEGNLVLMNSSTAVSGCATPQSPSSPVVIGEISRTQTQLVLCKEEDEEV